MYLFTQIKKFVDSDTLCIFTVKVSALYRFNYATGFLITPSEKFNLDDLRAYLLTNARNLCLPHLIGTFYRPGTVVEDYIIETNGQQIRRREISRTGELVNTYDWITIFFKASKTGLIQNFINENTRYRESGSQAIAV